MGTSVAACLRSIRLGEVSRDYEFLHDVADKALYRAEKERPDFALGPPEARTLCSALGWQPVQAVAFDFPPARRLGERPLLWLVQGDRIFYRRNDDRREWEHNLFRGVAERSLGSLATSGLIWALAALFALPRRIVEAADPDRPLLMTPNAPLSIIVSRLIACSHAPARLA